MLSQLGAALVVPALLLRRAYGLRFVGLTGGISSGKSAVTNHLRSKHSLPIIDFDAISREVVQPSHRSGALDKIRRSFGDAVIKPDGTLDREALGKVIFNDAAARARLSRLMKVPIWSSFFLQALRMFFRDGHREIILDVPLLFEAKLNWICSESIVVYVKPDVQKERLMKRDAITAAVADSKITAQWSLEKKAAMADLIIENNGSLEELHSKLDRWYSLHRQQQETQAWWKKWTPTAPTLILTAIAAPALLLLNASAGWMLRSAL